MNKLADKYTEFNEDTKLSMTLGAYNLGPGHISDIIKLSILDNKSLEDWDTLKTTVCKEQADLMRSYLDRPIYKRANTTYQGASERNYDFIIVRINAILACADLVRGHDPEKADVIEAMAISPDGDGLLDKLKRKEYVMSNETSFASEKGVIQELSLIHI